MTQGLKHVVCTILWLMFWLYACLPLTLNAANRIEAPPSARTTSTFPSIEPEFETLRNAESVDNKIITTLAQDLRGLIWIGTQTGLVRYDGYRFRKFTHQPNDALSLASDYIQSLTVAKDGRIWIGTLTDGISVFDPASEHFEHFHHNSKVPDSLLGGRIQAMVNDGQGGMWVATEEGLDHQLAGEKRFIHFKPGITPHHPLNNKLYSLLLDKASRLWVGSISGLQRLSSDGKSLETIVTDRSVRSLFQAQDGKLWLGTREHGAAWLMPNETSPSVNWLPLTQLSHPWIAGIAQVQTGQIWLASTGGGIIVVAASDGQVLQTLRHDPTLPGSLALDTIKPMLLDRAGVLWVGTWGGGLQRMNANNGLLRVMRHSAKRPKGLSHPNVTSLLEIANGQLLIGSTGNGLDIFDKQQGLIGGYRTSQGQPDTLPDNSILALAQTKDGAIWAGTLQAGVVRQTAGNTSWTTVPGLPGKQVRRLLASRDGSLWAGTNLGLARWLPNTAPQPPAGQAGQTTASGHNTKPSLDRFEVLADEYGKAIELEIVALTEDQQGKIWVGTINGLWLYEPGHKGLIRIHAEPDRPDGLISNHISGLLSDRHERLWISTDKGLERLQSLNGKLARFIHINHLVGETGKPLGANLLEDQQGRIWTEEGMIDTTIGGPPPTRMNRFISANSSNLGTTWAGSYTQTKDGLLLFGGTQGVAIIDPARFKPYDYNPPLIVSELKINGKAVAPQALLIPTSDSKARPQQAAKPNPSSSLRLDPTQRNFALEFAALDYSDPPRNRYQYRLQGYDKDWINTDADHRSAAYGNLWPGTYTLQIRGSNRIGAWSTHELHIPIQVLPAWWQTWWFWLVLLGAMSSLLAILVQTRTSYLHRRQLALAQLVNERTDELRQKQIELVDANRELKTSNTGLALSVETLRQLGKIGREITGKLDADTVFQALYQHVRGLLDAPTMTIYRMNVTATALEAVFGRDDDQVAIIRNIALDSPTSNAARAVRERQELLLHFDQMDDSEDIPGSHHMLTALFSPLIVDDQVLGAMSIQSDKPHAYGERECLIFRTLTAYGAIALANSNAHTELTVAHQHLQQTQQQLVLQEKMASLGTLTAGVAHEINNPTNFVHVSAQIQQTNLAEFAQFVNHLLEADAPPEIVQAFKQRFAQLNDNVATILNGSERIIGIVKDLRSFSRLDESARKTVRISECLLSTIHLVRNSWLEEIDFVTEFCDDPELECWPALLNQAFFNLLRNAYQAIEAKYAHLPNDAHNLQHGKLWLRLHLNQTKDTLLIDFQDNGTGIDSTIQARIMEPFFTTKEVGSGAGLGLSTTFGIVKKHGGSLEFTSVLGEGSCFTIKLPLTGVLLPQ